MRLSLCTRAVMALVALAAFGETSFANGQATVEMARARAEACVAIAKATASEPCQSQECKIAEIKADELIVLAKLGSRAAKTSAGVCQCSKGTCSNCECVEGSCVPSAPAVKQHPAKPSSPAPSVQKPASNTGNASNSYTFSPDRRTLTYDDGRVLILFTDGTYRPAPVPTQMVTFPSASKSASGGCVTVNGRTVCPNR